MYRLTGWALIVLGIVAGVASATLGWGLAALVCVGGLIGGYVILTDRRPREDFAAYFVSYVADEAKRDADEAVAAWERFRDSVR